MTLERRVSAGVWDQDSHEQGTDTVLGTEERGSRTEKKQQKSLMHVWAFARFVGYAAGTLSSPGAQVWRYGQVLGMMH